MEVLHMHEDLWQNASVLWCLRQVVALGGRSNLCGQFDKAHKKAQSQCSVELHRLGSSRMGRSILACPSRRGGDMESISSPPSDTKETNKQEEIER